ncbi:nuclease-related domain-containing protein [Alicyclobacillus acidoterrestris]|uniref:NERD domain-containing protein n=1 Tax=Alicyclobacillus acidoterrestris (strain ATCC 49025 / DSM 3922 / CIP 106132 / NCIMB 13137 / GD3B) TaxID=1356854 RepID=T0CWM7_ALIAG|nr:nuclease-related domain-containing protein [Alicyclobacillus acidoterrestris]EPZ43797.1 hypothetical protein N007_12145 [Alicyclobacillus acidoterrestris ATCC 49025]UNO50991.1 NERD domain-containing protein [Alicyclobacillus acidoterrestris]GEO27569.1 hypothetical protein AAC03nite_33540 [Alicyclobacillus acidoterrestris]
MLKFLVESIIHNRNVAGKVGELLTSHTLSKLPAEYIIRNNVLIPNGDSDTAQIDHVILSPYAIFVVETKNIHGRVTGRQNDQFWTVWTNKGTYDLYNPIRQNQGHIRALRNVLGDLTPTVYVNLIVFGPNATMQVDADELVGGADEVCSQIRQYGKVRFTLDQVGVLDSWLREAYSSVYGLKKQHVKKVNSLKR